MRATERKYDLRRFIDAQRNIYTRALIEIRTGRKWDHWMWYVFPQLRGLGYSDISDYYGIENEEEARQYLRDDLLGRRLRSISAELLKLPGNDPVRIMGWPDSLKLRSCMTLFEYVSGPQSVFGRVLDKFFAGERDGETLRRLR